MNFYARRVTRPADLPSIDCMRPGTFHFVSKDVIISHLSRINANWTLEGFRAAYSKYHYDDAGAIVYGTTTFIRGTEAAPPHQTYQVKDAAAFVRYLMKGNHKESVKLCIMYHFDQASFTRIAADNGALVVSQRELFSTKIYPRVVSQYNMTTAATLLHHTPQHASFWSYRSHK